MLRHKFFHRAKKVPVLEEELKAKSKKKERKREGDEKRKKEEDKGDADAESSHAEGEKKDDKQAAPSVSHRVYSFIATYYRSYSKNVHGEYNVL
jgi:Skp family chaperone for outer membrane proteins